MKENNRTKGAMAVTPAWPTDKNWLSIVREHNEMVKMNVGLSPTESLSGAQSITLLMVCAAVEEPIPLRYLLNNKKEKKRKKLFTHLYYVKKYLGAIRAGRPPLDYAKTIDKDVNRFANILKVDVQAVIDDLEKALKLRRLGGKKTWR